MLRRLAICLTLACAATAPLGAQDILGREVGVMPDVVPAAFAIKGATVHVGDGQILQNATIILRDGLIESVLVDGEVPEDAWVIDAEGLTAYPGMIDALTERGLRRDAVMPRQRPGSAQAGTESPAENPEGPGLFPHVFAADLLDPTQGDLDAWRRSGVLTLNIAPSSGIFTGHSAAVNLDLDNRGRMVVHSPTALRMSLQGLGFRTYPGSLMGVIAHIHQTFIDARHYLEAHSVYSQHQRGLQRPERNRALEALQPAVLGRVPVIFPAERAREIRRAIRMAEELQLKAIVAGGYEADRMAAELRSSGIPVLVNLDFPEAPKERHPEAEESLRQILFRQEAPGVAARLQESAVPFAFYSGGLRNGADFLKSLRKTVSEGLSEEAALRAVTLSAAEILGVQNQLGSIEAGKIANLILASGSLFDEEPRIRHVFVDGRKYDMPERPSRSPQVEPEVVKNLSGLWEATVWFAENSYHISLDLRQSRNSLHGTVTSPLGVLTLSNGYVTGDAFSFDLPIDLGAGPTQVTFSGTASGNFIKGAAEHGELSGATFEGRRVP